MNRVKKAIQILKDDKEMRNGWSTYPLRQLQKDTLITQKQINFLEELGIIKKNQTINHYSITLLDMRNIDKIIMHCSATKPSQNVDIETVKKWHIDRGFDDIGYHFYIRKNGQIKKGRDIKTVGAHCKGKNTGSIGICYEGGLNENGDPEDTRTENQIQSMNQLVEWLCFILGISTVEPHYKYANKACPCFDVETEYSYLNK